MTPPNPSSAHDPLQHQQRRARRPAGATEPLRRSRRDRVVAGVCGGIASFVGARPATVRWLWIASLLPSLGVTALAYPAMWWLLPLSPAPVGRAGRA
jgi:phage shock protein PspC (stress-responsive transcriptional regulator)